MEKVSGLFNHLKFNLIYYIIAVIGVTAFFAHENFAAQSQESKLAESIWKKDKEQRTIALEKLKDASKHIPEYSNYLKEKIKTQESYDNYIDILHSERFLGFKNFQQFMGEFGWAMGLFIYSLFNLVMVFLKKDKDTFFGKTTLHTTFITISIFYLRWCFNRVDYLGSKYVVFNLLTVFMILSSVYFLTKYKDRWKKALNAISRFAFIGVKKYIPSDKMDEYEKDSINVLKKGMK